MSKKTKRRKLTEGENDAYSRFWRAAYCYLKQPGVIHKIKRATHKRERREGKAEINEQMEG
jgi:hypothetical protein